MYEHIYQLQRLCVPISHIFRLFTVFRGTGSVKTCSLAVVWPGLKYYKQYKHTCLINVFYFFNIFLSGNG